jgi:TonB-linked SusC/RagA family outer membrane protein
MCILLNLVTSAVEAQDAVNLTIKAVISRSNGGTPIEGATIINKENEILAVSDPSGVITLEVPAQALLTVSAPGYKNKMVIASSELQNIALVSENGMIPVAFREVDAKELPVGVANVNIAELFEKNYTASGFEGLEAFAPGFNGNNMWGMNGSLVLIDGVPREISNVVPTEIDQITFLKSASAVALYGSRGAKGVILVTTKRGIESDQKIKVRANAGINAPKRFPGYLGSSEYMNLYNEARLNDGLAALYSDTEIYNYSGVNPYRYPSVDFYSSDYLKSSYGRYDVNTEISGGNDRARYYTNIGYNSSGSLLNFGEAENNNISDRFNIRGNVDMKLTRGLKARIDASAVFSKQGGVNTDYWSSAATFRPNRVTPLIPLSLIEESDEATWNLVKSSGNVIDGKYLLGGSQLDQTNPFAATYAGGNNKFVSRQFQFTTGVDGDLKGLLKGLSFNTTLGIDYSSTYNQGYRNGYATYLPSWNTYSGTDLISSLEKFGQDTKSGDQVIADSWYRQTISFSGQLNYNNSFNNKHNVSAILLGTGYQQSISQVYQKTTNSNLGLQLGYNFNQKYFAELSGALVHSPRLAEGNRSALSSAGSIGWMISEEQFLKEVSFIDRLKLTASAGVLYTDLDIDNYFLYESIYSQSDGTWFSWNDGVLVRTTDSRRGSNPDLEMARREEFSIGFEGSFFKNRLDLGANFFQNTMKGNPIQSTVLYPNYFTTGFPNSSFIPYVNFNNDQRTGFDFHLNYNKRLGNIDWTFGTAATYYTTKATKRAETFEDDYQFRQGRPIDALWGLKSNGFYADATEAAAANLGDGVPQPAFGKVAAGDIKYIDVNEDGLINNQDEVYLGRGGWSGAPLTVGVNLTARWKSFTVFALATGRFGAYAIKGNSTNAAQRDYFWVNGEDKYSSMARDRWTEATKNTATYPRLTTLSGDNNFRNSDFWLYNTDRLDLSKVQVSYDLPEKWLNRKLIKEMGFYVTGFNLLTVSKERELMEMNLGGAPQTRLYNLGIKAIF